MTPLPSSSNRRVLVAGCGFVGLVVARRLHQLGWKVTGLTHSMNSAQRLVSEPFRTVACDINDREGLSSLGAFDTVVDCVSSGRGDKEAYRRVYLEGAKSLLETIRPARFIFTGSTSVYAQTDGSVVTEESPAEPERETGKILRATEEVVLAAGGYVARLGGLYAPGRWAAMEKFLEGRAVIEGDGGRFINQIHRDDAAEAIIFLLTCGTEGAPSGIYNVTDGHPLTQQALYTALAEHFGRPLPPTGPIDLNRKRGWTHKQVSTAKLSALGWTPRYRTFLEALAGEAR
jgi:nucleoside-diphosphate-sugar epimerase